MGNKDCIKSSDDFLLFLDPVCNNCCELHALSVVKQTNFVRFLVLSRSVATQDIGLRPSMILRHKTAN